MRVGKEFVFHAAHNLAGYAGKCENLHGHSYRMRVEAEGPVREDGMVMDFAEISRIVEERVISRLDHSYLNDVLGGTSSLERLAEWAWREMEGHLPLCRIQLWETDSNFLTYDGPQKEPEA